MFYELKNMSVTRAPIKQGLYNPANERDACGVGFIAHIKGQKSHDIVLAALYSCHKQKPVAIPV